MVQAVLVLIVLVNGLFAWRFFQDFRAHRQEALAEPGSGAFLGAWGAVVFFLSTFGISDFALSTVFYRMRKLVEDGRASDVKLGEDLHLSSTAVARRRRALP